MVREVHFEETKALQIFKDCVRTLNLHLQLMDRSLVLSDYYVKKQKGAQTIAQAMKCDLETHPQLNIPNCSIDVNRTFATSRIKLNEQAIVELYRHFSNYIKNLIEELIHTQPLMLLNNIADNKENVISFDKIIKCNSYDDIIKSMADVIFRRFENERSTPKLLDKILSYTKINVEKKIVDNALLYLEIRHLIIHNNSRADDKFIKASKDIIKLKTKRRLPLNAELTRQASTAISELCQAMDCKLISKNMVRKRCIVCPN